MGVMKSTDGGTTWSTTGMSYTLDQRTILRRLLLNPSNPSVLLAGANTGIWRSTDAGTTWQKHKTGNIYDMEFNVANPNTVYAVTDSIFKSTDGGVTWNWVSGSPLFPQSTFYRRVSVAVTPANPNYVYVLGSELNDPGNLYRSTDGGNTFSPLTSPGTTFYGYWDNVLAVSPTDANRFLCAGANAEQTSDGGTTWGSISYGYVDHHDAAYLSDGTTMLLCNDGGIFRSTGNSNTNLSYGLQLTQYYAMGASATDAGVIYGGVQDRGTLRMVNGVWDRVLPNDGAEAIVDYTDSDIVYGSWQYGNFRKSTDGGDNWTTITPGAGSWTAPMVMHPTNPQVLFYGGSQVRKSIDGGQTWNDISTVISGQVISLTVSRSDPNYIYAGTYYKLWRTTDGGTSWTDVTSGLPTITNAISYVAVSGTDPEKVWVTFSGYVAGQKVYRSTDGGASWNNFSGTLPNVPVNCVEHDRTSPDDDVYIGTDMGVYLRDGMATDWTFFNTGLPRVIVHELEIHYGTAKIRAATHGRGLWEAPLQASVGQEQPVAVVGEVAIYPSITQGRVVVDVHVPEPCGMQVSVVNMLGVEVLRHAQEVSGAVQATLDLGGLRDGIYLLKAQTGYGERTTRILLQR